MSNLAVMPRNKRGLRMSIIKTVRQRKHAKKRPTPDHTWSALNRAVEEKYRVCLTRGAHERSGRVIDIAGVSMHVCGYCEVPF